MPSENAKHHIARAFSQAAAGYDQAAALQRQSGMRLLELLDAPAHMPGQTVLDIGAGSGHFSRIMQMQGAQVWALDLAEGMLRHISAHRHAHACLLGDAEALPLAAGSIGLCFSNLAVQWCGNLPRAAAEMHRVTRPGGCAAVATISADSLWQLRHAWQAADDAPHVNRFLSEADIRAAFSCFTSVHVHTETLTQTFDSLRGLLHSLKSTGANHVLGRNQRGLTGKHRWQRFCTAYENLRTPEGKLPLDYRITYLIAHT
ncbi:malonyl-ACP O-methyltransferase BioC [Uruburuella testudinis]|uniref:Malonyl-[acyl-carrier protein] O-methyltransferase n=1 Tax=Uruburuella testudinis TaxID=1282863 RepID=A0ABY4DQQ6_9NEIS|nr:malonyl-ACP O-methyltransferase BioC [Uruburuella testudinis]UOO81045.1 malonyl-ACP O-methyltransferase BioC [Uruburuella testudinis]